MIYPDISHHHKVKDWAKAKENCVFLISKATEGRTYTDPYLKEFINGCEKNQIPYWLYSFVRKGTEIDGVKFMIKTCKNLVGDYFMGYALDVETATNGSDPDPDAVYEALKYLKTQTGKSMLYTMFSQYRRYAKAISLCDEKCAWWEARYGKNNGKLDSSNPCHDDVELHQYTSVAVYPYFNGGVDLNIVRNTKGKDLSWYCQKTSKANSTSVAEVTKKYRVTANSLCYRSEPNLFSKIIGYLKKDDKCTIVEGSETVSGTVTWVKLVSNKNRYWISKKYLKEV